MRTYAGFPDDQDERDRSLNGENHDGRISIRALRHLLSRPATRGGKPAVAEPDPLTAKLLAGEQGGRFKRRRKGRAA